MMIYSIDPLFPQYYARRFGWAALIHVVSMEFERIKRFNYFEKPK